MDFLEVPALASEFKVAGKIRQQPIADSQQGPARLEGRGLVEQLMQVAKKQRFTRLALA
jgi:hypothetical protein